MSTAWTELKEARTAAGMTQQELAVKAGMSYSQISQLERGARDPLNVTVKNLLALSEALHVEPMKLVGSRRKERKSSEH